MKRSNGFFGVKRVIKILSYENLWFMSNETRDVIYHGWWIISRNCLNILLKSVDTLNFRAINQTCDIF